MTLKRLLVWHILVLFSLAGKSSYGQSTPQLLNNIPDFVINEDSVFRYVIPDSVFSNPNPDSTLITNVLALPGDMFPGWAYQITGGIAGVPLQSDTGVYILLAEAYYTNSSITRDTFLIEVLPVNDPPLIVSTISNQLKLVGFGSTQIDIANLFVDEEGTNLTYQVGVSPDSVISISRTGTTIAINEEGVGEALVEILASDGTNTTSYQFYVTVLPQSKVLGFKTQNTGSNGLVGSDISVLMEDSNGILWIATDNAISQYNNGNWLSYEFDEVVDGYSSIWQTPDGLYYFISSTGIRSYDGSDWTFIPSIDTQGLPTSILNSYVDDNNVLWLIGYDDGINYRLVKNDGAGWQEVKSISLPSSPDIYSMLYEEDKDKLWLGAWDRLVIIDNNASIEFSGNGESFNSINGIALDSTNNVWFITSSHTYKEENGTITIVHQTGGEVLKFLNEGIWVFGGYVRQYSNATNSNIKFEEIPMLKDALGRTLNLIYTDVLQALDGSIWIGTNFGLFHIGDLDFPMHSMDIFNTLDGLVSNNVGSIIQENDDNYWFSTDRGTTRYNGKDWAYFGYNLQAKLKDSQNRLWFREGAILNSGLDSLSYMKDGNWVKFTTNEIGLNGISDIKEGPDGVIWASAYTGGISKFDGSVWTNLNVSDGLLSDAVAVILVDSKNNLWVNYADDLGVSMFDGADWVHYSTSNGLSDNSVNYIMEDTSGAIWLSTLNNGISINDNGNWRYIGFISGSDSLKSNYVQKTIADPADAIWILYDWTEGLGISRLANNSLDHYTVDDGLPSNKVKDFITQFATTTGGRIEQVESLFWVAGDGLGQFALEAIKEPTQPPPVDIVSGLDDEQNNIFIYPNPVADFLHIQVKELSGKSVLISMTDLNGRVYLQTVVSAQVLRQELFINVQNIPSGIYLVEILNESKLLQQKVLKK